LIDCRSSTIDPLAEKEIVMRSVPLTPLLALALLAPAQPALAEAPAARTTTVTWHGHAAFSIKTPSGKVLFIDPWLKNPVNPDKDPIAHIDKADFILLTHGHFDHMADAVELAKKTGARLVAPFELGTNMARLQGFPSKQMGFDTLANPGGELRLADGEITVAFTPAVHSSGLDAPDAEAKGTPVAYGGTPVGYVIRIKDGPTIYHSGDTAYFSDMALIGERYSPDLALINIGGHFGMEVDAAARAAKAVKAKLVVPHHFKTFPVLTQDAKGFFDLLDKQHIAHRELQPGVALVFEGTKPKK
jgi:L-ascorbate metabolism protein UlaG (beta-lactamase superfamily)